HIPNLQERLKTEKRSDLVLEAIREGRTAPYGEIGEDEKLSVAFLDYFAQVAMNIEDPGLLRLITHKGSLEDKLMCLGISNLMQELKRHKYTLTFLRTFHEALSGTKPAMLLSLGVSRDFKPALKVIKKVAKAQRKHPETFLDEIRQGVPEIYKVVTRLFFNRLEEQLKHVDPSDYELGSRDDIIRALEVPTHFRALLGGKQSGSKAKKMTTVNVGKMLDELTFPALAAVVIGGAAFAAKQVLNSNRVFINDLAEQLGKGRHPERMLWLTDTLADRNGVSHVLQNMLDEIREHDYPIDILTCHPSLESGDHLHVVRPVFQYSLEKFGAQELCIPDFLEVQTLFERGGYDRIVCSTELMMGLVALYLKTAFTVPAHFFMHTDWMEFAANKMSLDHQELDRIRRLIRVFYQQFDGVFVLNNEHRDWLLSDEMELKAHQVTKTNHWVAPCFRNVERWERADTQQAPLLMFVGRLSEEKGVFDLPKVFREVRGKHPDAKLWIVGDGPAKKQLEIALPEATFLGWAEHASLPNLYRQADLLLLPSRFDTFGCVVLEAMSCGLPVAAYNSKGPRDI
ncbi:MAG: glycosyltransferase, partial [Pontibacterium sp.]